MKLSQGDTVVVIAGKDKGKKGTIMRILAAQNRVIVSGVNLITKHVKRTTQSEGKIVRLEASLSVSNVQIVDPKTGKPSRIGYKVDEKTGKKIRIAKKSGTPLGRVKVEKAVTEKKAAAEGATGAKKKGFWKKVGFGTEAAADDAVTETGNAPAQATIHSRPAARGK